MINITGAIKIKGTEPESVSFKFDSTSIKETIGVTDLGTGLITGPINFNQFLTETHATARDLFPLETLQLSWSVPKGFYAFDLKYLEINLINRPFMGAELSPPKKYFKLLQDGLKWKVGADGSLHLKLKTLDLTTPFIKINIPKSRSRKEGQPHTFFSYGFVFSFKVTKCDDTYFGRIDPLVKIGSLDGSKP